MDINVNDFVQINGMFIRKDTINTLVIEKNEVFDDDIDYISDDGKRPSDMFIIINNEYEYCIPDDDIDAWFTFIKTWFNVSNYNEVRKISGDICRHAKSRGIKEQ